MKFIILLAAILFAITGCSKDENTNPVDNSNNATGFVKGNVNSVSWYSDKITISKTSTTLTITAKQNFTNDAKFASSELTFKISVTQPQVYGIGENEPGFIYYVKAYYKLISHSGAEDENYKAYFENVSFMTINRLTDNNLDATYNFNAYTDDRSKAVIFTNGAIQIDY